MSEAELSREFPGNGLMSGKLFAVISGDGSQMRHPIEQFNHGLSDQVCAFMADLAQQCKARFALAQGNQYAAMAFTNHGIYFPISKAFSQFNYLRTHLNAGSGGYFTSAIIAAIPFATLFLATQMFVQFTCCSFVCYILVVDMFIVHRLQIMVLQPASDLFRAPVQSQLLLDQMPCLNAYIGFAFLLVPPHRFFMRLLSPIASSSTIALQFTADGRFVYTEYVGYFCLILMTPVHLLGFQKSHTFSSHIGCVFAISMSNGTYLMPFSSKSSHLCSRKMAPRHFCRGVF